MFFKLRKTILKIGSETKQSLKSLFCFYYIKVSVLYFKNKKNKENMINSCVFFIMKQRQYHNHIFKEKNHF